MANELFCLKWNNYTSNIITELDSLRADGDLVDVTILCDGRKIAAHKVILSACSSYFRKIFRENPCQHPVVILKDINYEDIEAVLCFVYQGTVFISKSRMESFLKTAESLQIRGLAGASNMMGDNEENGDLQSEDISKVTKRSKPLPPLASVSSNVPATAPPVSKNSPSSKRRKLVPNINQIENVGEEVQNPMNTSKIQNEDSRSFSTSILNRQDKHTSEGGTDNETKDVDEDSNTYSNTSYSRTDEVEDDNQLQYRDDNEENEEEEEECNVTKPLDQLENIIIKRETTTTSDQSKFCSENLLAQCSSGAERAIEMKSIKPSVTSNQDLNTGQQLSTEEELPSGSHLAQWGNCPHCGQKYSNQSALKYHVRLVHSDLTNRLCCYLCPRAFTHRDSFKKHMWERHKVRI